MKHVDEACEGKAQKRDDLFEKICPADGATGLESYYTAVKACGKRNKAENLMKGMVVDIQLLACEQGIRMATKAQREQPSRAIRQASDLLPSVSEHVFPGESGFVANKFGHGT